MDVKELRRLAQAAMDAEYAVMSARRELALFYCREGMPDEVAAQMAQERAAQNRQRYLDYVAYGNVSLMK